MSGKVLHGYTIAQAPLLQNNLLREVEIDSYVGGKKKRVVTSASMDTFCLLHFLKFFSHAEKRRIVRHGAIEYTWIDYGYLISTNPALRLNNAKIKRHLDILQALDLLDLVSDKGQVYFALKNYELTELMNHNQPVMNHNQERLGIITNPDYESQSGSIMNHNSIIINSDNNKYENIKNTNAHASDALDFDAEKLFETFWSKYPRKVKRQVAFLAFEKALSNKPARGKKMPKGLVVTPELIMQGLEQWIAFWKRENTQEIHIPHPATWLNDMCYLDSLEASPTNEREAIEQFNQQNGLKGDSAIKGYYNLPRHLQEERSGNWEQYAPKTEEERKERERIAKELLGWEY